MLADLRAAQPEVEIETIEVLTDPVRAVRDRVWMIPMIIIEDRRWLHAPPLAELIDALHEEHTPGETPR